MKIHLLVTFLLISILPLACDEGGGSTNNANNINNVNNVNNANNTNNTSSVNNTNTTNNTNSVNNTTSTNNPAGIYVGNGDVWSGGELAVEVVTIDAGSDGAPVLIRVYAPSLPGDYAVVLFQHGFLLSSAYYSEMLTQLASHGFIVVAPQMYDAGGLPFGKPTAAEEALTGAEVVSWIGAHLADHITGTPAWEHMGIAGHSRGGKVSWLMLTAQPTMADAVAGIDPVDGTGGPLGGEERVIQGPFNLPMPSYILGTGLGPTGMQACAPEGDNHEQFYEASASPAYHVVATDYGHLDMLDEVTEGCGMECTSCAEGPEPALMRTLTAAHLTAFFRASLQGVSTAYGILTDTQSPPVAITAESK